MKKLFFLLVMCLAALTMHAQQCAVLDFQVGSGVTAADIDVFSNEFRSKFNPCGFQMLERPVIIRTINNLGYRRTDMTQQQVLKVGQNLKATIIVVGTINKFNNEYNVEIRAIDVTSGRTKYSEDANFERTGYRANMQKTAQSLAKKLSSTPVPQGYVDLGLPSGILWKTSNEEGFYTWNQAKNEFDNKLPTYRQWKELEKECEWLWNRSGYKVIGKNGNSMTLPAAGYYNYGELTSVGYTGRYWSSTPNGSERAWYMDFSNYGGVGFEENFCFYIYSVRLVAESSDEVQEYVDLGLPSGTKWKAENKGGGYYDWETAVKKFGNKLPTKEQWEELLANCRWTWTSNGLRLTGKNGKSIFLPSAGWRNEIAEFDVGSAGYYWSSTPNGSERAWSMHFRSGVRGVSGGQLQRFKFSVCLVEK